MEQYTVTGMSCAACSARVEKAVSKVAGVTSCSVSLLTNSMGVEGTAAPQAIIAAVEQAGYGAALKRSGTSARTGASGTAVTEDDGQGRGASSSFDEDMLKDRETPILKRRFIASLVFLIVLMYLSMGHMMWNWPLPEFLADNHIAMGLVQLLLTVAIMVINQKFFISGVKGLLHRAPNMDTLVALGAAAAFGYSTYVLFAMIDAQVRGDMDAVMAYMHEFYFESAATILALITVGKMLEARSKGKTTDALEGLMKLAPKTATVVRNGEEVTVPVEEVHKGDIFVVRPGENIPVDGVILEGTTAVNEAALTGESIPADKTVGDTVSAATLNHTGFIRCEAVRVGEDTTLSQIIQMVSDAAATKAPIAKIADRVSGVFVPVVILIALVTIGIWLLVGQTVGFALARGISVLVISCPCALGLATPVAIMVGNGVGAKNGILFKTAASLEETGKVKIVALDKTGTITKGEPEVTDIIPSNDMTPDVLLAYAFVLEQKSEHPLAVAILRAANERGIAGALAKGNETEATRTAEMEVAEFQAVVGNGLTGRLSDGAVLAGGNLDFIQKNVIMVSEEIRQKAETLAEDGKTPLFFSKDGQLLGIIAVADTLKEDSPQAVQQLQDMGIRVVMLTGDNERTAKAIGRQAGVDEVIAGVLPDGKESVIRSLQEKGKVAMVGDGINDAPALTRADMGIAIGAGTDIAMDAADVVLMKSRLSDVPAAIRLSRATLRNIHENLFWAFCYNVMGIPLAAGVWYASLGWKLNPMFGAAAMSLSSFCVVTNALRLNLVRMQPREKNAGQKDADQKDAIKKEINKEDDVHMSFGHGTVEDVHMSFGHGTIEDVHMSEGHGTMKEVKTMTKTMEIKGMMCGHCEARVKKSLEALPQVEEAVISHEKGTAVVTLNAELADDVLRQTVEAQDYQVVSIQ